MTAQDIGQAAGSLWARLSDMPDGATLSALKKTPGIRSEEAVAAVGWLAREGKLRFEADGRKTIITLARVPVSV